MRSSVRKTKEGRTWLTLGAKLRSGRPGERDGPVQPLEQDAGFIIAEGVAGMSGILLCGGACGCGYNPQILRLHLSQSARQTPLRKTTPRKMPGTFTNNFFGNGLLMRAKTAVVLGAQWGDEGKGKIVDVLSERFSAVARYAGGHNAGHTGIHGGGEVWVPPIPRRVPGKGGTGGGRARGGVGPNACPL